MNRVYVAILFIFVGSITTLMITVSRANISGNWLEQAPWPLFSTAMNVGNLLLQSAPITLLPPQFRTLQIATDFLQAQSLYVVTKLSIADYLGKNIMSAQKLAEITGTHPGSLCRLLKFMSSVGYFNQVDPKRCIFENNRHSEILMEDHPTSMKDVVLHMSDHYENFINLLDTVKVGAQTEKSKKYWAELELDSTKRGVFARAMMQITRMESKVIAQDYDFSRFKIVADIGGGTGIFMTVLLRKHRDMQGLLFDLPNVIGDARKVWNTNYTELQDRVEFIGGDFFSFVPNKTRNNEWIDAYVMRSILHDWSDQDSVEILKRVRASISNHAKLLLVDIVFNGEHDNDVAKRRSDMMMQIIGGKERTEAQFESILRKGGFKLLRIVPTRSHHSVIEAVIM